MSDISPLAPKDGFPNLPAIDGVSLNGIAAGVKYQGRMDLMLAALEEGSTVAGTLTQSKTRSAAIDWCRNALKTGGGTVRGIIVNAGNSNAFTGKRGVESNQHMVDAAATVLNVPADQVYVASTGVIGEQLPADRVSSALPALHASLSADGFENAAKAIMTTDTFPKGATASCEIDGKSVTINGFAKGSGMIAPDMATMLSFIFTDAAIPHEILQTLVSRAVDRSFNCMTVDGDTSTSDTLIMAATGKAGNADPTSADDAMLESFYKALEGVLIDLAQQIAKDGEGASKFITINVTGAVSDAAAKTIALSIANSPLVKTAIAGEDANWGRIVMAIGKSGEEADRDRLSVAVGGVVIAEKGEGVPDYDEAPVAAHLKGTDVTIDVDLALGQGQAQVWTCDLTHGYISINADYRS